MSPRSFPAAGGRRLCCFIGAALLPGALGRRALFAAPGEWAGNAATRYAAVFPRHTLHSPLFVRERRDRARESEPGGLAAGGLSFAVSLAAVGLAGWRRLSRGIPDPGRVAAAALLVHGCFRSIAVFGVATLRCVTARWPLEALGAILPLRFLPARRREAPPGSVLPASDRRRAAPAG